MSRDGSGTYTLPAGVNPVVSGTTITDEWANTTLNDVAAALSQSLSKDGQTTPSADLPMGNRKHTGVADPTARNNYASLGVVQDNRQSRVSVTPYSAGPPPTGSTGNAIVGSMSIGTLTAYAPGQLIVFTAYANNTGAVTININGVGAKSILSKYQTALVADDLLAGKTYLAYYNDQIGTGAFILISEASSSTTSPAQVATSGWIRPASGSYTSLSLSGSDVVVPAGQGYIISPGTSADPTDTVSVISWAQSTVVLTGTTDAAYTTLAIDSGGQVVQFPGRIAGSSLRTYILLGYVNHIDGTVRGVVTAPEIWLDDGYQAKDTTELLHGTLVSGCRVTSGTTTTKLNVANGTASLAGGTPNSPDFPNVVSITGASPISFFPFHGTQPANFSASTDTVDFTNYNPAQAETTSAMTAGYWTFHRLYWLYGQFVMVYGQSEYNFASFSEALSYLPYDESKYKPPLILSGATFLATILVKQGTAAVDNGSTGAIICKGKETFGIGSTAGFTDAPSDSKYYGRRNAAWAEVLSKLDPAATGDITLTEDGAGNTASLSIFNNAGTSKIVLLYDTVNSQFQIDYYATIPTLAYSMVWDLATGGLALLDGSTIDGNPIGNVVSSDTSVADGAMVLFDGTGGLTVKEGSVPGNVVTRTVQTSSTDNTAGRVLLTGAWGLGTTEALQCPEGTTAQRPGSPADGMIRHNSTTDVPEMYFRSAWQQISAGGFGVLPWNYITGMTLSNNTTAPNTAFDVVAGQCADSTNAKQGRSSSTVSKSTSNWAAGGTTGSPQGGKPTSTAMTAGWWAVFALIKDDGTVDFGIDTSTTAANLLGDAAVLAWAGATPAYRRIGWLYWDGSAFLPFTQTGDLFKLKNPVANRAYSALASQTTTIAVRCPPGAVLQYSANIASNATTSSLQYDVLMYDANETTRIPGVDGGDFTWRRFSTGPGFPISVTGQCLITGPTPQIKVSLYGGIYVDWSSLNLSHTTTGWVDSRGA